MYLYVSNCSPTKKRDLQDNSTHLREYLRLLAVCVCAAGRPGASAQDQMVSAASCSTLLKRTAGWKVRLLTGIHIQPPMANTSPFPPVAA